MSQLGFLLAENIYQAYILMLMMGLTMPGKSIVFYNYAIELTAPENKQLVINVMSMFHNISLILITLYYQNFQAWYPLQVFALTLLITCFIFVLGLFEESPRYLYTKKMYRESRAALKKIASFNGVKFDEDSFIFEDESTGPVNHFTEIQTMFENEKLQKLPEVREVEIQSLLPTVQEDDEEEEEDTEDISAGPSNQQSP
jgi:hypothetical protein